MICARTEKRQGRAVVRDRRGQKQRITVYKKSMKDTKTQTHTLCRLPGVLGGWAQRRCSFTVLDNPCGSGHQPIWKAGAEPVCGLLADGSGDQHSKADAGASRKRC